MYKLGSRNSKSKRLSSALEIPPEGFLCNYQNHLCNNNRLHGYEYCIHHILHDKSAPYKQCMFMYSNNKRCIKAAPKSDKKDGYCLEHAAHATSLRQHVPSRKRPVESAQLELSNLSHYKQPKMKDCDRTMPTVMPKENPVLTDINLFKDIDGRKLRNAGGEALEYTSDGEASRDDAGTTKSFWIEEEGDSDDESVCSDADDPLRHAGTYADDEIIKIMKDKLIRLQRLYIDQFSRLHYALVEARRRFVRDMGRAEREEVADPVVGGPGGGRDLALLRAMRRYHRHGKREALLQKQYQERRVKASNYPSVAMHYKEPQFLKCVHALSSTTKCGLQAVPMSKYCYKHIIEDTRQVLFRTCGFAFESEAACETPVAAVFDERCLYHTRSGSVVASAGESRSEARRPARVAEVDSRTDVNRPSASLNEESSERDKLKVDESQSFPPRQVVKNPES